MMKYEILLQRKENLPTAARGRIYFNNVELCRSLERPWVQGANKRDNKLTPDVNESTCILPGLYELVPHVWSVSKSVVPMLVGTPDRDGILIHTANKPSQLLGCIAPGMNYYGTDGISESGVALTKILAICKPIWDRKEKIYLRIENAWT